MIGFLPAMGWIGDTDNGRVCWYIIVAPNELVLLTTSIGMLPLVITIVLYGIILYHALHKIVQLKKATSREDGLHTGNLRLFVGGQSERNLARSMNALDEESKVKRNWRFSWCCRRYIEDYLIDLINFKICLKIIHLEYSVHSFIHFYSQTKF